jgi:chromatin remodeling complex protein RSC6
MQLLTSPQVAYCAAPKLKQIHSEEKSTREQAVNKFAAYIDLINLRMSKDRKNIEQELQKYYHENTKKY